MNKRLTLLFITAFFFSVSTAMAAGSLERYTVNGMPYEGFYISPAEKAPLVILIHDWDGLTDYEIKRSRMLADLGYAVFAADLFGAGIRPTEIAEKKKLTGALYADRKEMRDRMAGAIEKARSLGADVNNAVVTGYCFGGTAVLELARSGADLKAFIPFHGGLDTPDGQDYRSVKGEVLVFHGSADASVPMDAFAGLALQLEAAGIPHEMITYSGAPHAFTVWGSDRYRERADRRSWQRFTAFLNDTLR